MPLTCPSGTLSLWHSGTVPLARLWQVGWTHKVEIEDGVAKLFEWYCKSLE